MEYFKVLELIPFMRQFMPSYCPQSEVILFPSPISSGTNTNAVRAAESRTTEERLG